MKMTSEEIDFLKGHFTELFKANSKRKIVREDTHDQLAKLIGKLDEVQPEVDFELPRFYRRSYLKAVETLHSHLTGRIIPGYNRRLVDSEIADKSPYESRLTEVLGFSSLLETLIKKLR